MSYPIIGDSTVLHSPPAKNKRGPVAQLGARTVRIRKVEGSIPFGSTTTNKSESCAGWWWGSDLLFIYYSLLLKGEDIHLFGGVLSFFYYPIYIDFILCFDYNKLNLMSTEQKKGHVISRNSAVSAV